MVAIKETRVEKVSMRKQGNRVAFLVIGNQVVFQFGTLIMMIVISIVLSMLGYSKETIQNINPLISSDLMQLVAGIIFLVFYLRNRKTFEPMKRKNGSIKIIFIGLMVVLGANMICSTIEVVFRYVGNIALMPTSGASVNDNNLLAWIVLGAVFPAIFEELTYRCVLYRVLRLNGIIYATVVSSIIFGLVHMNFIQIPFAFCLGCVCCFLYEYTGKIRYSMLIHFINNSIMFVIEAMPVNMKLVDYVQAFTGVVCFVFICIMIIAKRRKIYIDYMKEDINKIVWNITSGGMLILAFVCVAMSILMINA